jgi:predicted dienelactone hydrolase
LRLAALAVFILALAAAGPASAGFPLPRPAGPAPVGTVALWWVDPSRLDPLAQGREHRQLMVQIWYPAAGAGRRPARYLPLRTARILASGVKGGTGFLSRVDAHAQVEAPVAPGRHPVVLFSPGFSVVRGLYTSLVEDLASRGYVVVALDHTYEPVVVEFPGGRLERRLLPPVESSLTRALEARVNDVRFVVDRLAELAAGAGGSRFTGRLDLARVGMFGHSLGGATAAETMLVDGRIRAGIDLDGSLFGRAANELIARPFMLIASQRGLGEDASLRVFLSHLDASHLALQLAGSGHLTFSDLIVLARPLARLDPQLPGQFAVGTIPAGRALAATRAYVAAFFDAYLRGQPSALLRGPSARYPEMRFRRK